MSGRPRSGTVSILLHANVAGAAALLRLNDEIAQERIGRTLKRLGATIARYRGRLYPPDGESITAEFENASDAVSAALVFQATQREYIGLIEDGIEPVVQAGIAPGEVALTEGRVTGAASMPARQIAQLAGPGGVGISAAIVEALPERFPLEMQSLGKPRLEGVAEPLEVCRVVLQDGAELPPPGQLRKAKPLQPMGTMRALNRFLLLAIVIALIFALLSAP